MQNVNLKVILSLLGKKMVDEFNIGDNDWINRLYGLNEKWCLTFNLDVFSSDIRSSQRSETANRIFHEMVGTN